MDLLPIFLLATAGTIVAVAVRGILGALRGDPARDSSLREDVDAHRLGELAARKALLLRAIQGAGLDRDTGKMSEADHQRTVLILEREAVGLMKEIDALGGEKDDLVAVDRDIAARVAAARAETAGDWSPAARARHAGRNPATEPA